MRLALDAMGGDDAPLAMVRGAIDYALAHPDHTVVLVGREPDVRAGLAQEGATPPNIEVEHAPEVIGMAEKIAALKERPNDSMNRCAQLVKQGKADAMVLCGNTGCSVAAAQLHLRRIPGVKRAGILTPMPTPRGFTYLCDSGANTVCRPEHLVQFAEMASAYVENAFGIQRPKVGVLSNGEEEGKGSELTHLTLAGLQKTSLNVVGNVEGNDLFTGLIDVVICDGLTGNIVLKAAEGVFDAITKILKDEISSSMRRKLGYALVKPAFDGLKSRAHWSSVGGCPLIGVDGVCIIGHGRSNRVAVRNALRQGAQCVAGKAVARLREYFKAHAADPAAAAAE
jgi:glycerol-3-phosphate acyltransferase PlsX